MFTILFVLYQYRLKRFALQVRLHLLLPTESYYQAPRVGRELPAPTQRFVSWKLSLNSRRSHQVPGGDVRVIRGFRIRATGVQIGAGLPLWILIRQARLWLALQLGPRSQSKYIPSRFPLRDRRTRISEVAVPKSGRSVVKGRLTRRICK